jgi:hypothetical protein
MPSQSSRPSSPRAWIAPRWLGLLLAGCLLVLLLPLVGHVVLPFHDVPAIMGLAGTFAHVGDPTARIADFYDFDFRAYPSVLYFGWGWLAARLGVPTELAFRIFLGLFCVAGPPLALLGLLRAFERPRWLVLLALPAAYHHQIWFGFLGSAASVTGLIAAVALAKAALDRATLPRALGLATALLFVAVAHPFSLALTLAIVLPFLIWPAANVRGVAQAWSIALRLAALAPTILFLRAWAQTFFGRAPGASGGSVLRNLRAVLRPQRPHPIDDLQVFVEYLGNGYEGHADELVPLVALATLIAFAILGARVPRGEAHEVARSSAPQAIGASGSGPAQPTRRRTSTLAFARTVLAELPRAPGNLLLAWALLLLLLGFLLLPNKLVWPDLWWEVRVRCVAPLYFLAIAAVRGTPRGLRPTALAPAVGAAVSMALFMTWDFASHWRGRVLVGFEEALAKIPPGRTVMALVTPDPRYVRPHPFLVQHYVARKGGRASPQMRGHRGAYWVVPRPPPLHPDWGRPELFVWADHSPGYDYFLVEGPSLDAPGAPAVDLLAEAPPGALRVVSAVGRWRLYERLPASTSP